jgi:predicted transcriptional regulator
MTKQIAITLTDEQAARLGKIADARDEPLVAIVAEAVTEFLDYDAEFRKAVQEGMDDFEAGRTHDWEDIKAGLRAKYGDFDE